MTTEKLGLEQTYLLAEIVMKVVAIERLLTNAGIITSEALTKEMKLVAEEVSKFITSGQFNAIKNVDKN